MEHKLGEVFQYNDEGNIVTLQTVLEDNIITCEGCFFNDSVHKKCNKEGTVLGWCTGRKDNNTVKFKQINTMEEKRNIQISLEEAREWYNSDDSFKKELALKAYSKEELELSYFNILHKLPDDIRRKNALKSDMYLKLINTASYVNSIIPAKYTTIDNKKERIYYTLDRKTFSNNAYKGFIINKIFYHPEACTVIFNSEEAAKRAIDILGDELKILFEC